MIRNLALGDVIAHENDVRKELHPKSPIKIGRVYQDGLNRKVKITGWSQPEKGFCGIDDESQIRIYDLAGRCTIRHNGETNDDILKGEIIKRARDASLDLIILQ